MKMHTIKNRWFLPILSCAALAMTSHSQAAVIVTFAQVGDDVVATWTGSFDAGLWAFDELRSGKSAGSGELYGLRDEVEIYFGGTAESISGFSGLIDAFTGSAGFVGSEFLIGGVTNGGAPGSSFYDFNTLGVTQTFQNDTLADIGAASFNNTLAWTSSAGGTNTISYTTIPEPSSSALVGLGALALAVRRRR